MTSQIQHAIGGNQILVKLPQLVVPDGLNARSDLPEIEALSAGLKAAGQLTPIVVTVADDGKYEVVCGARRVAAFQLLKWKDDIMATIREYTAADPLGGVRDNWIENKDRIDTSPFDDAERVSQLLTGKYWVPKGATATPLDQETVAKELGKDKRTIQKLAKIHANVDPDVAKAARKLDAPMWLVIKMSQTAGEGETREDKEEDRAKKQMKLLEKWYEQKKDLEAAGRQRAERGNGKGKGKAKNKRSSADEEEWGAIDPGKIIDKKDRTASDYFALLGKKLKDPELESDVRTFLDGAFTMMRFLSGEVGKLTNVTEADWKALMKPPAEEEEGDEGEIEEE